MKNNKRQPKYMGTGIYVHQQFRPEELVKGDTFFDADYGEMIFNGAEWVCEDGNMASVKNISDVWPGAMIYVERTGRIMEVTNDVGQCDRYIPKLSVDYLLEVNRDKIYRFL